MAGVKGMKHGQHVKLFSEARHGIRATYSRGCRCDPCTDAWRIARGPAVKAWRARLTPEQREAINAKRRVKHREGGDGMRGARA